MFNILFVCMGNICRSPTAEGFFRHHLRGSALQQQVSADSAGTHGYHIGDTPDPRAIEAAQEYGVDISHLRARKVTPADFRAHDMIVAMDHVNLAGLEDVQPRDCTARVHLMMSWHPNAAGIEVPDPYYGDFEDFRSMCGLLDAATAGLLADLETRLSR